ncbi:14559_t:CDS:1, partial [Gigaspora rosea]
STQEVFNEYLTDDEFIHIIYVEKSVNETNNANNPNDVVNEKNDNNNLQKYQIEEETRLLETKLNKSSEFSLREMKIINFKFENKQAMENMNEENFTPQTKE